MSLSNSITLVGNLTKEPDLKYTSNGTAALTMSVAVNRRWTSQKTGETSEVVAFFSVVTFGALAENVAESLKKGDRVVVNGRVDQRSWQDEDGGRHTSFEVVADEVATSLRFCTAALTKVQRAPVRIESAPVGEPGAAADRGELVSSAA